LVNRRKYFCGHSLTGSIFSLTYKNKIFSRWCNSLLLIVDTIFGLVWQIWLPASWNFLAINFVPHHLLGSLIANFTSYGKYLAFTRCSPHHIISFSNIYGYSISNLRFANIRVGRCFTHTLLTLLINGY